MTFEEAFPLCFYINLGRRQDRRVDTEERLEAAGIKAIRFPAVDALHFSEKYQRAPLPDDFSKFSELEQARLRKAREVRGYDSPGRYALALTQRMAIREAKRRKMDAVMLLEDDVVLHPNFANLFQSVHLPDDWGIFYLGCSHQQKPEWVGARCVKLAIIQLPQDQVHKLLLAREVVEQIGKQFLWATLMRLQFIRATMIG